MLLQPRQQMKAFPSLRYRKAYEPNTTHKKEYLPIARNDWPKAKTSM